jgi:hypothetical protein
MSLVLSGSTSGSVTLQEPAVAGTTVIDLPATSGTMVVTGGAQTVQFAAGSASTPSITTTGDTNTGIFFPAADTIAFSEGGTEAARFDSSGNLLVGTSSGFGSGTYGLRVSNTAANGFGTLSLQGNRTIAEDTIGLVQAFNSSTEVTRIGSIQGTNATSGQIVFSTASTGTLAERMRINSTGALVLAGGTTSANGIGITFPATQSASSDANTLDDYEEGTFTPTVIGTLTAGTASYSTQQGRYTKIGNRVLISIFINYTGGTGTGSIRIAGLPFAANGQMPFANYNANVAMTAGHVMQAITAASGSTAIDINSVPTGGGSDANVPYDAAGLIMLGGNYDVS